MVSDGGDNHSRYSLGEVRQRIDEGAAEVYSVNIAEAWFSAPLGQGWLGGAALEDLCEHAAGRYDTVADICKLPVPRAATAPGAVTLSR